MKWKQQQQQHDIETQSISRTLQVHADAARSGLRLCAPPCSYPVLEGTRHAFWARQGCHVMHRVMQAEFFRSMSFCVGTYGRPEQDFWGLFQTSCLMPNFPTRNVKLTLCWISRTLNTLLDTAQHEAFLVLLLHFCVTPGFQSLTALVAVTRHVAIEGVKHTKLPTWSTESDRPSACSWRTPCCSSRHSELVLKIWGRVESKTRTCYWITSKASDERTKCRKSRERLRQGMCLTHPASLLEAEAILRPHIHPPIQLHRLGLLPSSWLWSAAGQDFVLLLQGAWLVRERALPENFLFLLLAYATSAHTYVSRNPYCSYYPYYREYLFWSQLLSHDSTSSSSVWPWQPLLYSGRAVITVVSQELSSVRTPRAGILGKLSDQVPS